MSEKKEQFEIVINDRDLYEKLKSFSEAGSRSVGEVTEAALREYLAADRSGEQPPDEDVFNPDPGA